MDTPKKLYKVLVSTEVGGLSYEAGQTYELTDEQAAAFAANEVEDGAVTPPETPETPEAPVPPASETPEAPAPEVPSTPAPEQKPVEPAKPWAGNHTVGRE